MASFDLAEFAGADEASAWFAAGLAALLFD